jgi:N6-adenosine-specific RNA methylase IME4
MSLDEIKSLPVNALAGRDAVLFLWATFPQLPEALETIKAWGFKYKTIAFDWVKLTRGGASCFGASDFGPEVMRRSVCWPQLFCIKQLTNRPERL